MSTSKNFGFENMELGPSVFGDSPVRSHDHLYLSAPPEREKSYYRQVATVLEEPLNFLKAEGTPVRLVDMGCATGDFVSYLTKRRSDLDILGVDYHLELVEEARERHPSLDFQQGSILEESSLNASSVDVMTILGVLSMFDDIRPALTNCSKWIRSGGYVVIFNMFNSWPVDMWVRFRRNSSDLHSHEVGWNLFSEGSVTSHLMDCGFAEVTIHPFIIDFDLKETADPLRSWRVEFNGKPMMFNGLSIVQQLKIMIARRT